MDCKQSFRKKFIFKKNPMTIFSLNQITSYNINLLCNIFRRIHRHLQATNETDKMIQSILFKQIFSSNYTELN